MFALELFVINYEHDYYVGNTFNMLNICIFS